MSVINVIMHAGMISNVVTLSPYDESLWRIHWVIIVHAHSGLTNAWQRSSEKFLYFFLKLIKFTTNSYKETKDLEMISENFDNFAILNSHERHENLSLTCKNARINFRLSFLINLKKFHKITRFSSINFYNL